MGIVSGGTKGMVDGIDGACVKLLTKAAMASVPVTSRLVSVIDRTRTREEIAARTRSRILEIQAITGT